VSIDRLSSTAALIAALRAEITRKTGRTRGESTKAAARGQSSHEARRHDPAGLRRELAAMVKGISIDDDEAMNAVRPRVVRAVLLWEFGAQLREYGEWQPMLDTLVRTLECDNRHREEFASMIRELQR